MYGGSEEGVGVTGVGGVRSVEGGVCVVRSGRGGGGVRGGGGRVGLGLWGWQGWVWGWWAVGQEGGWCGVVKW